MKKDKLMMIIYTLIGIVIGLLVALIIVLAIKNNDNSDGSSENIEYKEVITTIRK